MAAPLGRSSVPPNRHQAGSRPGLQRTKARLLLLRCDPLQVKEVNQRPERDLSIDQQSTDVKL